MESVLQKKCPACSSYDVADTGDRVAGDKGMSFGDIFSRPALPIYKCNHCRKTFIFRGDYREKRKFWSDDDTIGGLPT